jgi:hypothetical protein
METIVIYLCRWLVNKRTLREIQIVELILRSDIFFLINLDGCVKIYTYSFLENDELNEVDVEKED